MILRVQHGLSIFICSVSIGVILFFLSIKPLWLELKNEREKEKYFQATVPRLVKVTIPKYPSINDIIDSLVNAAQQKRMVILAIDAIKSERDSNSILHMVATGTFVEFMDFLLGLNQSGLAVILNDFDWHVEKNAILRMNADFSLDFFALPSRSLSFKFMTNPFVSQEDGMALDLSVGTSSDSQLGDLSVHQLRFAGSLVTQGKQQVWLGDLSGKIWVVNLGEIIGKERAKVLDLGVSWITLGWGKEVLRLSQN